MEITIPSIPFGFVSKFDYQIQTDINWLRQMASYKSRVEFFRRCGDKPAELLEVFDMSPEQEEFTQAMGAVFRQNDPSVAQFADRHIAWIIETVLQVHIEMYVVSKPDLEEYYKFCHSVMFDATDTISGEFLFYLNQYRGLEYTAKVIIVAGDIIAMANRALVSESTVN